MEVSLVSVCRERQQGEEGKVNGSQRLSLRYTGQKKTPEKKDGRRMSFQRPKGSIEYSVSTAQATKLFL
ncbi:Oxidation resistance protein 1 [Dissostichus eleginoides]|uniref:Oxidation resistance protein 1 n=1 Tax=Dissostichus eleginoides TaxID=100907 RepID=A0AAD9C411_DISEL|nr:Oxidation resistance protein 1 [Dissostichus eleginoides]